jgi:hypothetical protein
MKNTLKLIGIIAIAAIIGFSFVTCGGGDGITIVSVTGVTLNKSSISLAVGETEKLTATISPSDATNKTMGWSTSDFNVANVASGTVTAIAAGSATIIVTTANGKTAECTVTVTSSNNTGNPDLPIPVLSGNITINPNSGVYIKTELTATYSGSETVSYQWKKGDTYVGTNSNKFTPATAGSYTVTVSAAGYNSKTSAVVDVNDPSLSALGGNITINPNSGVTTYMELTALYSGSETVSYHWEKDGSSVGTNSNKYTPTEEGNYTVTVNLAGYNSKTSAAVTVTLSNLSGNIIISPSTNIYINTQLTATYSGSETVSYHWKKDGSNVGMNSNTYTPTEAGSYTVTVSAIGYNSKTSFAVDVNDLFIPTLSGNITISPNSGVTTYMELTATYSGSETVGYLWEDDEGSIVKNSNKFTPTEAGSYTVTVYSTGYNSKTSAAVIVTKSTGAVVSIPTLNAKTNNSITVNAVAAPSNRQTVEYAKNTVNTAPSTGWQTGRIFYDLTANTTYFIFARSKENASYNAGIVSAGLEVKTDKSAGASVSTPTLNTKTYNSITVNVVTAPSNGQIVEYAKNTINTAPSTGWQDGRTFSGLTTTTYFIFARSKENASYNAGNTSSGLQVKLTYNIGDPGPAGGTIFYYNPNGFEVTGYGNPGDDGYFATYTAYYLEIASDDQVKAPWGDYGRIDNMTTFTSLSDGKASLIGNGRKDTQIMVNYLATTEVKGTAAQLCASKNINGFTDWFLPSLGELKELYKAKGKPGIPTIGWLWSSSQGSEAYAWYLTVSNGDLVIERKSTAGPNFLAVRAF